MGDEDEVNGKIVSIQKELAWVKISNGRWGKLAVSMSVFKAMRVGDELYAADVKEIKEDHVVPEAEDLELTLDAQQSPGPQDASNPLERMPDSRMNTIKIRISLTSR